MCRMLKFWSRRNRFWRSRASIWKLNRSEDYILPNTALASRELDANYFQHIPYLNSVIKDHAGDKTYDFVSAGAIHIEPIGIYSKNTSR